MSFTDGLGVMSNQKSKSVTKCYYEHAACSTSKSAFTFSPAAYRIRNRQFSDQIIGGVRNALQQCQLCTLLYLVN